MYNEKVEAEVQRRLIQSGMAPITEATRATDLIERLFGDRPQVRTRSAPSVVLFVARLSQRAQDKKNMWIAAFEENEIPNVGAMRKLSAS